MRSSPYGVSFPVFSSEMGGWVDSSMTRRTKKRDKQSVGTCRSQSKSQGWLSCLPSAVNRVKRRRDISRLTPTSCMGFVFFLVDNCSDGRMEFLGYSRAVCSVLWAIILTGNLRITEERIPERIQRRPQTRQQSELLVPLTKRRNVPSSWEVIIVLFCPIYYAVQRTAASCMQHQVCQVEYHYQGIKGEETA